jgi:hypothetical protein
LEFQLNLYPALQTTFSNKEKSGIKFFVELKVGTFGLTIY